jgi:dTDP-L-rhamnose 4-epimerase
MSSGTVLITGGAGFIGGRLARALAQPGRKVRVLDNLNPQIHGLNPTGLEWLTDGAIEFRRGSVEDRQALASAMEGADTIVHLAAETGTGQSMYEISRYNGVNSQGTAVLLDILANQTERTVRRIILASSRSIYGEGAYVRPDGARVFPPARSAAQLAAHEWDPLDEVTSQRLVAVATHEADQPAPASIYAATKYAQEDLIRVAAEAFGLGYAILRFQNVYGEGQSLNNPYTGILSIFSTRIRRGIELPLFEDGEESRDFVHVDDVVAALRLSMDRKDPPNAVINVGSGQATSVREIAERLSVALGRPPMVRVTGQYRLGDIRHNWADIGRLKDVLGFTPQIALADGLGRFAAWADGQPLPEDRLERANRELTERNLMGQ